LVEAPLEELAGKSLSELLHLLASCAERFDPPPGWSTELFLATPAEIVKALGVELPGNREQRLAFLRLCSRVHQALIGQTLLQSHYFRLAWLAELGPTLALAIVQLRSRCFWSEQELRDETSVHFTALAREVGCTPQWLRRSLGAPEASAFVTLLQAGRGRKPVFRVLLREPITPADWGRYHERLMEDASGGRITVSIEGLKKVSSDRLGPAENEGFEHLKAGENPTSDRLGLAQNATPELLGSGEDETPERHGSTMVLVSTQPERALKEKHLADPSDAVHFLLESFGIGPPSSQRIAARSRPEDVRAWMLYALTQRRLLDTGAEQGFLVNRLVDGQDRPRRFQLWPQLTAQEWRTLWRGLYYGGMYRERALLLGKRFQGLRWDLRSILQAWQEDFGGVFPKGPFGQGPIDLAAAEESLLRQLDTPDGMELVERGSTILAVTNDPTTCKWLVGHADEIVGYLRAHEIFHDVKLVGEGRSRAASEQRQSCEEEMDLWRRALDALRLQMTRATYETCLGDSRLIARDEGGLVIGVPNSYARDWVEARLKAVVLRTVARLAGRPLEVQFVVERER
jgi:hypothetical protein